MLSESFPNNHLTRRALMKGLLATSAGGVVMNWGGLTGSTSLAAEVRKQKKHCIFLFMNGGASQFETFDMKPGRPTGGPFRPIDTNVSGVKVCELLPHMAKQMDKKKLQRWQKHRHNKLFYVAEAMKEILTRQIQMVGCYY